MDKGTVHSRLLICGRSVLINIIIVHLDLAGRQNQTLGRFWTRGEKSFWTDVDRLSIRPGRKGITVKKCSKNLNCDPLRSLDVGGRRTCSVLMDDTGH